MTAARKRLENVRWFPGKTATGKGAGAPAGDVALATNGFLSALLLPEDRDRLRQINTRLTEIAIDQCGAEGGAANQIDFGTPICLALADFAAHGVLADDLLALSRDFVVVFPWSLSYGDARTPFNVRLVRLPLAVAFPRTVDEVVSWVSFVRDHGLSVSIRSGNNSYEGLSSSNDVVIDLSFLTLQDQERAGAQLQVDLEAGVVHVASGVRLGVLYTELARLGVAVSGGQCAPVCVGGLVGTSGVGFTTRQFGFACDQVEEIELVLADGSVVVANAGNEYADLYRASKGAGAGGLGVMTRLTLRLVPAVPVLYYIAVFDLADGAEVIAAWQNLAAEAPDELSSIAAATGAAGRGLLIINGDFRVEDGDVPAARERLLDILQTHWFDLLPAPLRSPLVVDIDELTIVEGGVRRPAGDDSRRPMLATVELTTLEATNTVALQVPMPTFDQWKLKSKYTFRSLTAAELQPVLEYLETHAPANDPTQAVGFLNLLLMGGQSNRIDADSAAVPAREGTVLWVHAGALWNDDSVAAEGLAFVDGLWTALDQAVQSSTAMYGCPDLQLGSQLTTPPDLGYVHAYWSSPTHDLVPFLIGVKNKYDPTDVFKGAQSIPLAI